MAIKSDDYRNGFTAALVFLSDLFEQRSDAFLKKGLLRKKDVKLICSIIDACIRRREVLMDVGPKKVNLFIRMDGHADIKER